MKTLDLIPLNYNETIGLKGVISELTGKYTFIKKIILYGSKARGVFIENSDLDLLFVTQDYVERQIKYKMNDIIYDYEVANDIVISAIFISEAEFTERISPFLIRIRKEGIIIWSRE